MKSWMRVVLCALVATLVFTAQSSLAGHREVEEFSEAEVLVEINATDGDAGFQGKIDGDAWRSAGLFAPRWRKLFYFALSGSARRQGFTEFVWESAEPTFDVFGLAEFLERFPEGTYRFHARTLEGGLLYSAVELTHQLPAGPRILSPGEGAEVSSGEDLEIRWEAVTTQFAIGDPLGESSAPLENAVVGYIVVAEFEDGEEDVKEVLTLEVQVLPGDGPVYSATIPGSFMKFEESEGYKIEVGVVEESGNRTFIERVVCTDMPCPEEDDEE